MFLFTPRLLTSNKEMFTPHLAFYLENNGKFLQIIRSTLIQ